MVLMVFLVWMAEMELMEVLVSQEKMYESQSLERMCLHLSLIAGSERVCW